MHLFSDHNLKNRDDFDKNYTVALIDFCSPKILEVKEHTFIHILNTSEASLLQIGTANCDQLEGAQSNVLLLLKSTS